MRLNTTKMIFFIGALNKRRHFIEHFAFFLSSNVITATLHHSSKWFKQNATHLSLGPQGRRIM
jgi:hypothetical protein